MKKIAFVMGLFFLSLVFVHCGPTLVSEPVVEVVKEAPCSSDGGCSVNNKDERTPDGVADEKSKPDALCVSGETRPCYAGPAGTKGKGLCKEGFEVCKGGVWGACLKAVLPTDEICDGNDNNCDGVIDEDCSCIPDETQNCYPHAKGCKKIGSSFSCIKPCKAGKQKCSSEGKWETCEGASGPPKEVCNGKDDDCDGKVDNLVGFGGPCIVPGAKGICKAGRLKCAESGRKCIPDNRSVDEVCDGKDNDCDGIIDNHLKAPLCAEQKGTCKGSVQKCDGTKGWIACTIANYGKTYEAKETKCDNIDNDCNGQIDENISRVCYSGKAGTAGTGPCKKGTQNCSEGGWAPCNQEVIPKAEICDNKDNDCDGQVDESLTRSCYTGKAGTAGKGLCKKGSQTCSKGAWAKTCSNEVIPKAEICDNKDNDCDGSIDESLVRSCYTGKAGSAGKGPCKKGTQACSTGTWAQACSGQIIPQTELCDGIDNDCDGQVDNHLTPPPCFNQSGVCKGAKKNKCLGKAGWEACSLSGASAYKAHSSLYAISETICDKKDNDCDGVIDELCVETWAGSTSGQPGKVNGPRSYSKFKEPRGMAFDTAGNLYIADSGNYVIRRIDTQGWVSQFAGVLGRLGINDTSPTKPAKFLNLTSLTFGNKTLYALEWGFSPTGFPEYEYSVRMIDVSNGKVSTLKITGLPFIAGLDTIVMCGKVEICISDSFNKKFYRFNLSKQSLTIVSISHGFPLGLAYDSKKDRLFFSSPIKAVNQSSILYELNQKSIFTYPKNTPALTSYPAGLAFHRTPRDVLYISNSEAHTIEVLDIQSGVLRTLAGKPGTSGVKDGYGPTTARFHNPTFITLDPTGKYLFISDTGNHSIRRMTLE